MEKDFTEKRESALWFVMLAVFAAFVFASFFQASPASGAYDGSLPADNSKVASGPQMIRENNRALKDDGIVNAGRVASETVEDFRGVKMSCIASTTSTALLSSSSAPLNVGTATGTYLIIFEGNATASSTGANLGQSFVYWISVRVGTTTEIIGTPPRMYFPDPGTELWKVNVASGSSKGEVVLTVSGPVGAYWEGYARKRKATW